MGHPEMTRGRFLATAALMAGGAFGIEAAFMNASEALAESSYTETEALNLLLAFELIQVAMYERGLQKLEGPPRVREMLETLHADDVRHQRALTSQIEQVGGEPEKRRSYAFTFFDTESFLWIARTVEAAGVKAYNGAIPVIQSGEARRLAGSIVQVEGRHAAAVRLALREEPTPESFEAGRREYEARSSIEEFTGRF